MRYALISDIHANLPALRSVLSDIDNRGGIDAIYHLGDLTGYAPWPNETIALIRERGIPGISGNYDSTIAADYKHCGCRADSPHDEELSHQSYEWTRARLLATHKDYLRTLPFRIDIRPLGGHVSGPTITLIHGNQTLNTVYVTHDRSDDFLRKMSNDIGAQSGDAICFGHTHKPWHRVIDGIHFVNTGSVGRPKDGNWQAGYVIVNTVPEIIPEFIRVPYDVDETADAIRSSDLPAEFADQLLAGGSVSAGTRS
jgi:predicted phosphodiesterase